MTSKLISQFSNLCFCSMLKKLNIIQSKLGMHRTSMEVFFPLYNEFDTHLDIPATYYKVQSQEQNYLLNHIITEDISH